MKYVLDGETLYGMTEETYKRMLECFTNGANFNIHLDAEVLGKAQRLEDIDARKELGIPPWRIEMDVMQAYLKKNPDGHIERVEGPFKDEGGCEYYHVYDANRAFPPGTVTNVGRRFYHESEDGEGRKTFRVQIGGKIRPVVVTLMEGYSSKDHMFGEVLLFIEDNVGKYSSPTEAEADINEIACAYVPGGPMVKVEVK